MKRIPLAGVSAVLVAVCGCQSHTTSPSPSLFPDDITGDAHATYAAHVRATRDGTQKTSAEIAPAHWADRIKALKPIKVYSHRVNIVVVQGAERGTEEGTYIYIPISSYLPQSGDDGFTFTRTDIDGVYDYGRSLPEH